MFSPWLQYVVIATSTSKADYAWPKGMYPSLIVLIMAKHQSVFGNATFVACSENNPATHEAHQQKSRALSGLQFASAQASGSGDVRENKDNEHVIFSPDAGKAVWYCPVVDRLNMVEENSVVVRERQVRP